MEPGSDGTALVSDSSQRLVALSGMTSVASLSSLWAAMMLPLSRGYLMITSSLMRSMVVTPMTVGLRFNMRVGSAQTSVTHVHKDVAALLTLTSSWVGTVEPFWIVI